MIERLRRATSGRFDILTPLGEGGMASVFLARDLTLDRLVAIKVMHPSLMTSPAALGRFRSEARIAASLDHPHVISVFAVGEDPELAYFVMRYVEGRTLHQVIAEQGALPIRRAIRIIDSAGQALQYAHRRGVTHRDVKPANIMLLDQDDWVVVTDFGLAKLDEGDQLTLSGHVVGTPRYMCPEYFESGKISNASDQYALGVVAFELLTGEVPFGGNTVGELMRGHLLDAIPSVRALRPELPEALDEILARMLAKDPDARYANIGDAIAALRAATVIGPSLEEATEIIRTPSSGVRLRLASSGAWRAVRRRPGFAAIVGATVLVVSLATVASKQGEVSAADPSVLDSLGAGGEGVGAADRGESPRATAPEERTAATPPSIGPRPAAPDPSSASLNTPVTAPPPAVPSATGTILIGSRLPLAALYVGDGGPRIIGEQGVQTITADAGPVRLSIRVDGCVAWDTTFTVSGGGRHTIGYRAPRC